MEVSLPQTMLQKLLDLLKLESFRSFKEFAIQSIIQDQKDAVICTHIDYHNQHESAALIGLFHVTSSVLTSVESYPNYRKPTQRGVQGYLSSLQRRVEWGLLFIFPLGPTLYIPSGAYFLYSHWGLLFIFLVGPTFYIPSGAYFLYSHWGLLFIFLVGPTFYIPIGAYFLYS